MTANTTVTRLRAEYRTDSPFVATRTPRLSWVAQTSDPQWAQRAVDIELDGETRRVWTDQNAFVSWPFAPLPDDAPHTVRVRLLSGAGEATEAGVDEATESGAAEVSESGAEGHAEHEWSEWSEPLTVRCAVVDSWTAPFIGLAAPARPAQPVLLGKTVQIPADSGRVLTGAVLHVAALGAATALIDGVPVDASVLGPGFTSYDNRVLHDSVDVLGALTPGDHQITIELTGAWYTEEYGFGPGAQRVYGEQPAVSVQLHLRWSDGTTKVVVTDDSWLATGEWAVVDSGLYAGETVDLKRGRDYRVLTGGAATATNSLGAAGDSSKNQSVQNSAQNCAQIMDIDLVPTARAFEPVRRTGEVAPQSITVTDRGTYLLDFGQNLVGRLRLNATEVGAHAGTEITVQHAEVLNPDGTLAREPLRRAAATDTFILGAASLTGDTAAAETTPLAGNESVSPVILEPQGTFHGFRYAEISGWPGELTSESVRAVVIHSDLRRTGWFESSHAQLNKLHENVVWSMRSNFLAIPTDCPQRDERMGWTGDAQVFAPAASTLFDCNGFLANWLEDVSFEQEKRGGIVPFVVPDVLRFPVGPTAAWGDAITVIPDVLAERFLDTNTVEQRLNSMIAWVEAILPHVDENGIWADHMQLGDWLDPDAPPEAPGASKTPGEVVGTAFLFRSASIVAHWAQELGRSETAVRFAEIAERTRQAFLTTYVTPAGRMASDTATGYALALRFNIATDPALRIAMGNRLAQLARKNGYRISTGFVGTPHLLDALVDTGHTDAAERLLLQTALPSWLYPITMGATTVWERWDSMLPDGSINPGEMTSFNHYAFGAVVDYLYRRIAGISPAQPAYRHIDFAPVVLSGLDHANATIDTPSGTVTGGWRRDGNTVRFSLVVPAHSRATVTLPGNETLPGRAVHEVGPGRHSWTVDSEPAAPSVPLTLGSTMREVAANPAALEALYAILEAHDPALAATVRYRMDWNFVDPIVAGLFDVPPHLLGQIAGELARCSSSPQPNG